VETAAGGADWVVLSWKDGRKDIIVYRLEGGVTWAEEVPLEVQEVFNAAPKGN
jgi:hypothetical protein